MTTFLLACREANVILGPVAFGALGYRAAIGYVEERIVYWPLFVVFTYYVLTAALVAPTSLIINGPVTYLQAMFSLGHLALIFVCVFYPGPLIKGHTARTSRHH